jgi:hypothetical protein
MSAEIRKANRGEPKPVGMLLAVLVSLWCASVLYMFVCVDLLGLKYPFGSSALATLFYGLFFLDPYSPHREKLDLPIALIHAFALYKSGQWLWRHGRPDHPDISRTA